MNKGHLWEGKESGQSSFSPKAYFTVCEIWEMDGCGAASQPQDERKANLHKNCPLLPHPHCTLLPTAARQEKIQNSSSGESVASTGKYLLFREYEGFSFLE